MTLQVYKVQIWKAPNFAPQGVEADIFQAVQAMTTEEAMRRVMQLHHLRFAQTVVVSPSSARQGFDSWYQVSL